MSDLSESTPKSGGLPPAATRAVLFAVAIVAAIALFWPRTPARAPAGPGGTLVDTNGRPVPLARELKQVTLVHFWATWCPPCVGELPQLVRFARAHENDHFHVVFVAVADEPEAAKRFFAAPDLTLLFDPTWDVAHRFGTDQIPETHVVVGDRVVKSYIGANNWDDPRAFSEIQKWTATPTSAAP